MITHSIKLSRPVIAIRNPGQLSPQRDPEPISVFTDRDNQLPLKQNATSLKQRLVEYEGRIADLENSLQTAREESFNAGFEEGKEIGIKEIKIQIDNLSKEFISTTGSLEEQYQQTLQKLQKPLVKLSIKIARKIIGGELQNKDVYDRVVTRQMKRLLSEVSDQNKITIYLNPEQHDRITSLDDEDELSMPEHVNLISRDDVPPGECMLESDDYILDGLISRQLQNIEDRMLSEDSR